jgi:hypothetical protein
MAAEEEKKRMADFQVSLNQKKAEKSKANTTHIRHLEGLLTLEEVLAYWSENCIDSSFFIGIFGKDVNYKVEQVYKDRDSRLKILEAEMKRIENKYLNDLLSIQIKNRFDLRVGTDPNTYKQARNGSYEDIKRLTDSTNYPDFQTKQRSKGFKAYKGGNVYELRIKDLGYLSIGIENRRGFRHIYEGYLLARLKAEIKSYSNDSKISKERIKVNITADRFAVLMYILSQKGVFDLSYFDFNDKYYNGESTARLIQSQFEIISQQGPTKGIEVSFETLKKSFKQSVIESTKGDGVNNLFKALDDLPKLAK